MTIDIDSLETELADLTAHVEVATHRQLTILRTLEPTGFWCDRGAASFAHWLGWRLALAPGAAREKLRVARALGSLPSVDAAFATAKLSYSKVRALTRVATKENEALLLDMALQTTAAHLEQICRGLRSVDAENAAARDVEARWVRQRQGEHGMVRIDAQLHPDEAAIVWQAIERARATATTPHADALVQVARSFDLDAQKARPSAEVVVHVREELLAEGIGAMAAVLDDGRRVPAETLRRVACDCVTHAVAVDGAGLPIDVGRKRRTVTPALRRALVARDACCRFPGCAHRAWLDAHHIEHWLHGGETAMRNLVLLCPFHHRLVHEGGYSVTQTEGHFSFTSADGRPVLALPARPSLPRDPVAVLRLAHVSAGTSVSEESLTPEWWAKYPTSTRAWTPCSPRGEQPLRARRGSGTLPPHAASARARAHRPDRERAEREAPSRAARGAGLHR